MCISTSQASLHAETFSDTESFDCRHYGIIVQFLLATQTLYYYFFIFQHFQLMFQRLTYSVLTLLSGTAATIPEDNLRNGMSWNLWLQKWIEV